MKRAVLADTTPLFALADKGDQYHSRSLGDAGRIRRGNRSVMIARSTIVECHALVVHRLGTAYGLRWLADLRRATHVVNPTEGDYGNAVQLLERYPEQTLSLADAVMAVLSDRLRVPVWTYDHHFDLIRAEVWR